MQCMLPQDVELSFISKWIWIVIPKRKKANSNDLKLLEKKECAWEKISVLLYISQGVSYINSHKSMACTLLSQELDGYFVTLLRLFDSNSHT